MYIMYIIEIMILFAFETCIHYYLKLLAFCKCFVAEYGYTDRDLNLKHYNKVAILIP